MQTHQGLFVFIGSRASPKEKQMAMNYATVSLIMGYNQIVHMCRSLSIQFYLKYLRKLCSTGFWQIFTAWQKELKNNKFHVIEYNAKSAGTIGIKPRRLC